MVSNISFGSTYKVQYQNNGFDKFRQFQDFCLNQEMRDESVGIKLVDEMGHKYPYEYSAQLTMVAPDSMDNAIETYCANQGIQFKKYTNEELMSPRNIKSRIKYPQKGMTMAKVDVEKLEELMSAQNSNLQHCQDDYDKYYNKKVDLMLKSADEIPATTLYITPYGQSTQETLRYIKDWGKDSLNEGQLFVDFNQETDEPDHCMYFAMRDMGMKQVPVYVNRDTYKIANALGILANK